MVVERESKERTATMRFKLKTPFFDYARDQIKGGVWYRPTWWDAVANVPPVHFQPRIKKKEVPSITFLEDRLVRRFQARNPSIAAFDRQRGGAQASLPTVTRQFIDQQMEAMRNGTSEVAAYAATRNWLLGNGPRLFAQLDVPAQLRGVVAQSPSGLRRARGDEDAELLQQIRATQEALREGGASRDAASRAGPQAKQSAAFKAREALAKRALSLDPQLPRRTGGGGAGGGGPGASQHQHQHQQ